MAQRTLVIAPHPDDELLGCGGTLMRRVSEGGETAWAIVTGMSGHAGFTPERILQREREIERVSELVGFANVFPLGLPPAQLDRLPLADIVEKLGRVLSEFQPDELLIPHGADVHSDHRITFAAATACAKWFRYPAVRRVLAYETPSETEFSLDPGSRFTPNVFVDIGPFLDRKLEAIGVYESELAPHPFPRNIDAIRARAIVHGATAGFAAAEAFQLLRERHPAAERTM